MKGLLGVLLLAAATARSSGNRAEESFFWRPTPPCLAEGLPPETRNGGNRLLRTMPGHRDQVRSVAYSPDGERLLSGSWDRTIKLWSARTGELLRTLEGHASRIDSVAFLPDGRRALSASADHTIILWDLEEGRPLRALAGHAVPIHSVAVSPDGRRALSGDDDGRLKLWELEAAGPARDFADHGAAVWGTAFSPDGRFALSGGSDDAVKLWDVETGRLLRSMEGHRQRVMSVAFSPDGAMALSGSRDTTIKLWRLDSGKCLRTLKGHANTPYGAAFSPERPNLALSAGHDNVLKLWDISKGKLLDTLSGHKDALNGVAFSPDGACAVSGSGGAPGSHEDDTVRLWEIQAPKIPGRIGPDQLLSAFGEPRISAVRRDPSGHSVLLDVIGSRRDGLEMGLSVATPFPLEVQAPFLEASPLIRISHGERGLEAVGARVLLEGRSLQAVISRQRFDGELLDLALRQTAQGLPPAPETTPLHLSAGQGRLAAAIEQLAAGADPSRRDENGRTPIERACADAGAQCPKTEMMALLLGLQIDSMDPETRRRLGRGSVVWDSVPYQRLPSGRHPGFAQGRGFENFRVLARHVWRQDQARASGPSGPPGWRRNAALDLAWNAIFGSPRVAGTRYDGQARSFSFEVDTRSPWAGGLRLEFTVNGKISPGQAQLIEQSLPGSWLEVRFNAGRELSLVEARLHAGRRSWFGTRRQTWIAAPSPRSNETLFHDGRESLSFLD